MQRTAKIAISLPQDLLETVEKERSASGETRSQFLRRAIEAFFRRQREREADEQYVRAYIEQPETEEEVAAWTALALESWADNPWEEEEKK